MHSPAPKSIGDHSGVLCGFTHILRVRPYVNLNIGVFFKNIQRVLNGVYPMAINVFEYLHKENPKIAKPSKKMVLFLD